MKRAEAALPNEGSWAKLAVVVPVYLETYNMSGISPVLLFLIDVMIM